MLKKVLQYVFGPTPRFLVGDSVEPVQGDRELMVVKEVVVERAKPPRLLCQWTDAKTNLRREALFDENELQPFDWYRPLKQERPAVDSESLNSRSKD